MATTATTPSELILAIDSTIRTKVTPNSITPATHSDLLDNVVGVLSADTYTTSGDYSSSASTITFEDNNGGTYSVTGITSGSGGSFTGNTSGDCISDIYVSTIHSCSALELYDGQELVASFESGVGNGFILESGINMTLPNGSEIINEFSEPILSQNSSVDSINEAGVEAKAVSSWSAGSPIYDQIISGTSSATTTTSFITKHDIVSGQIINEINGAGLLSESVETTGAEAILESKTLYISGDTGNTITSSQSTSVNEVNEIKEYLVEGILDIKDAGYVAGYKESLNLKEDSLLESKTLYISGDTGNTITSSQSTSVNNEALLEYKERGHFDKVMGTLVSLKEASIDNTEILYISGDTGNTITITDSVIKVPLVQGFLKEELIASNVDGIETLYDNLKEYGVESVENIDTLYISGDTGNTITSSKTTGINEIKDSYIVASSFGGNNEGLQALKEESVELKEESVEYLKTLYISGDTGNTVTSIQTSSYNEIKDSYSIVSSFGGSVEELNALKEESVELKSGSVVELKTLYLDGVEESGVELRLKEESILEGGLMEYNMVISGASSATTATTIFETSYDLIAGDIKHEFNGVETLTIGENSLKYQDGNEALGYILTSDADGKATWQASSGGTSPWSAGTGNSVALINNGNVAEGDGSVAEGTNTIAGRDRATVYGSLTAQTITWFNLKGNFYPSVTYSVSNLELWQRTIEDGNPLEVTLSGVSGSVSYIFDEVRDENPDIALYNGVGFPSAQSYTQVIFTPVISVSLSQYPAHAEGLNTIATGITSHAEGELTIASGTNSHTEGLETIASGFQSHAEGADTLASGFQSHAEGDSTIASGIGSHAEGMDTLASGQRSHAEGVSTSATTTASHAEGVNTLSNGFATHAEGIDTTASSNYSHAEGNGTSSTGQASHSEGEDTLASATNSHAEGINTVASGVNSHAEGEGTVASGTSSHAEGRTTVAGGLRSHAEGINTVASGNNSHAEGNNTTASGDGSHAEGQNTTATTNGSHAEGQSTTASGDGSHAEGGGGLASGLYSHAEGQNTTASGLASHAEGQTTVASGVNSHAEGFGTVSSGTTSHSEGENTIAGGNTSHAEGNGTLASGSASHAEGRDTLASGSRAHAEGHSTIASGEQSHSQGHITTASEFATHAGGISTVASGYGSFIHSINSTVTGYGSAVLGGQNITGATADTVYMPKVELDDVGGGIIMKSPDGTRYRLTIANGGTVTVSFVI